MFEAVFEVTALSRQGLLLAAGLGHAFQLPAMSIAARKLGWSGPPDRADESEINRRINRVLVITVPALGGAVFSILLANLEGLDRSPLLRGLSVLLGLWAALVLYRHFEPASRRFARLRVEIVLLLSGLGLLVCWNSHEVQSSALGSELCVALGCLYAARTWIQLGYYRRFWPRGALMRAGQWALVALFSMQSAAYLWVAAGGVS
jgi:hypothetical protein